MSGKANARPHREKLFGFFFLVSLIIAGIATLDSRTLEAANTIQGTFRLTPSAIAIATGEGGDPAALIDRATHTTFTANGDVELTINLGGAREVSAIKVFGASPYLLAVKAERSGGWETMDGLERLDLRNLAETWHRFESGLPVTTGRLLLVLSAQKGSKAEGLKEIEIWGKARATSTKSARDLLALVQGPMAPDQGKLYAASPAEITIGGEHANTEGQFSATVDQEPRGIRRAWLVFESQGAGHWISSKHAVNGGAPMGGSYFFASSAWTTQLEPLAPSQLIRGVNTITFQPFADGLPFGIRNVHLLVEQDNGANFIEQIDAQPHSDVNLAYLAADGDGNTGWTPYPSGQNGGESKGESPTLSLLFDKPTVLEAMSLSLRNRLDGRIDIELLNGGEWQRSNIGPFQGKKLGAGENRLEMSGAGAAEGVRLVFVGGEGSSAEITEVQPIGSGVGYTWGPAVRLAYPLDGEYYGDSAYVRAFVQPFDNGSGPAAITVAGTAIDSADGALEALVSKAQAGFGDAPDSAPWSFDIEALYPDGRRLVGTVQLYRHGDGSLVVAPRYNPALSANTVDPYRLEHDEGMLDLDSESMDGAPSSLTITSLASDDLPPLDPGMTNVTKGPRKGYRFGPHGKKFKKNIQVKLPYDTNKLLPGMTESDIKTYYFDEEVGHWVPLERVSVDKGGKRIVSHTDHFTDMINATLTVPEHPQAASFNPTQIKDIKAADPGAGINLIEPPDANNMGDARLSYPIEIPPGRKGMQPQLAIQYNSGGGNGWLGLGWDLSVPSISVDTRWGAPRYHSDKETETYLLNGEMLTPVAHRTDFNDLPLRSEDANATKDFHARVEGSFRKITRHGNTPNNYWWEITDKNGTRHFYGKEGPGKDKSVELGSGNGVYRWMIRTSIDTNGNTVDYEYDLVCDSGIGNGRNTNRDETCDAGSDHDPVVPGYQLYLKQISYTGHTGKVNSAPYQIEFVRDSELDGSIRRPDVIIDARGGFKNVTAELLREINVYYQGSLVRGYELDYEEGAFKKKRLIDVVQLGGDGDEDIFNRHQFSYYDELPASTEGDGYSIFAEGKPIESHNDSVKSRTFVGKDFHQTLAGGTFGSNIGYNGSFGITFPYQATLMSGNARHSGSTSESEGKASLVDIDGDGKPDKVFVGKAVTLDTDGDGEPDDLSSGVWYRKNITTVGDDRIMFSEDIHELSSSTFKELLKSRTDSSTTGFNGYAYGATAFRQKMLTTSIEDSFFSDVNGDGLVDYIKKGRVHFGYVEGCTDSNTGVCFASDSWYTPNAIDGGAMASTGLFDDVAAVEEELKAQNPPMDAIRRWVAPYNGVVRIGGTVQLHDFYNDPSLKEHEKRTRERYETDDGVMLAIQTNGADHNGADAGSEYWRARIEARDATVYAYDDLENIATEPRSLNAISVNKGDRIYFRVISIDDGSYDRVNWSPDIEYIDDEAQAKNYLDVNNRNVYHYNSAGDMIFAGQPVDVPAPYDGVIHFTGTLRKAVTTDDVTFNIDIYEYNEETESFSETPKSGEGGSYSILVPWDDDQEHPVNLDFDVETNDKIIISYLVDSPIDLTELGWSVAPRMYYTEATRKGHDLLRPAPSDTPEVAPEEQGFPDDNTDVGDINVEEMKTPPKDQDQARDEEIVPVLDGNGDYAIQLPVNYNADIYSADNLNGAVQAPWKEIRGREGYLLVTPWLSVISKEQKCRGAYEAGIFGELAYQWDSFVNNYCDEDVPLTPDGEIIFTIKRHGELLYKHIIQIENEQVVASTVGYDALKAQQVKAADELFLDFTTRDRLLAERIIGSHVRAEYGSDTPWKVPFSDSSTITVESLVRDSRVSSDENVSLPGSTVMVLIRDGETILARRKITIPAGNIPITIEEAFSREIIEGQQLYFDVFSAEPHISIVDDETNIWTHYPGAPQWSVPQSGAIAITPVLSFKEPNDANGRVLVRAFLNDRLMDERTYLVTNGELAYLEEREERRSPISFEVNSRESQSDKVRVEFWTNSHRLSSVLETKGDYSIDYVDADTWTVPDVDGDGINEAVDIEVSPSLSFDFGDETAAEGEVLFRVLQGGTELASQVFTVRQGQLTGPGARLNLTVKEGAELRFDFNTSDELLLNALMAHHVQVSLGDESVEVAGNFNALGILKHVNALHILMPRETAILSVQPSARHYPYSDNIFGETYRGWGQAAYLSAELTAEQKGALSGKTAGDGDTAEDGVATEQESELDWETIEQGRLILSNKKEDYTNYETGVYPAAPNVREQRWDSADGAWHVGQDYIQSTRRGLKYIDLPKGEDYLRDPTSARTAGIVRVPRISVSHGYTDGGGYILTYSRTRTNTFGQFELMDLNGDLYPDIITGDAVQYTHPNGRMGELESVSATRKTYSEDETLSYGGGTEPPINPNGKFAQSLRKPGSPFNISVGGSVGFGDTNGVIDYMDMNGDGLLDKVSVSDNGLYVGINLGYDFAPSELWRDTVLEGEIFQENFEITRGSSNSYGISAGWASPGNTFSGGVNLNLGINDVSKRLMDVNGDGLTDYVFVEGSSLKVALNLGGQFATPIYWGEPLKTIDDISFLGDYGSAIFPIGSHTSLSDGLSTSVGISGNGTTGITMYVPTPAPVPWIDLVIAGGGSYGETVSQPTVGFSDLNGDGYLDSYRSKSDNDLDVSLSQVGRTNLLKSVSRPLGAAFELEYTRAGNTYELPQSRWVMSRVKVFDGKAADTPADDLSLGSDWRIFDYTYSNGRHDRYEREFLGFSEVITKVIDTSNAHATAAQTDPLADNSEALDALSTVYREVKQTYSTASIYSRGLLLQSQILDGNDALYRQTVNTYKLLPLNIDEAADDEQGATAQDDTAQAEESTQEQTAFELTAAHNDDPPTALMNLSYNAATVFPYLEKTTNSFHEGGSTGISTTIEYEYDGYGNVHGLFDEANSSSDEDDVYAEIEYSHEEPACLANYIVGTPTEIIVKNGKSATNWERKRTGEINCATGNLSSLKQYYLADGIETTAETKFTLYDTYGNLEKIEGPANKHNESMTLRFGYDGVTHTYPITVINDAYGYSSSSVYNYALGKPLCTTDINGNAMAYEYDSKGRVERIVGPYELPENFACEVAKDDSSHTSSYGEAYTIKFFYEPYTNQENEPRSDNHARTQHHDRENPNNPIETILFTDGLKQVLQTKKDGSLYTAIGQAPMDAMIISGRTILDPYGRVVRQYYPSQAYKGATDNTFIATVDEDEIDPTETTYDILDRTLGTTLPDTTVTSMSYDIAGDRFTTTVTTGRDGITRTKTSYRDVRELITRIEEEEGITTTYAYDFLKQIEKVTDVAGNETTVDYDKLGRRIAITNPDTGATKMSYDGAGNLSLKQSANHAAHLNADGESEQQFIEYLYDHTRLVAIHYPNYSGNNNVSYTYGTLADIALNQVGRVKAINHQGGRESREYGKLGEVTREEKTLTVAAPGGGPVPTYTTEYDFDTFGRLMTLTLPDGETLTHAYDNGGLLRKITGRFDGADYDYLGNLEYDKFGQRRFMAFGNGVKTLYRYDEQSRRLCNLQSGTDITSSNDIACQALPENHDSEAVKNALTGLIAGAQSGDAGQFQNLHYAYDPLGNILGIGNAVKLTTNKELGGPVWQTFGYDKLDRLTTAVGAFETHAGQFDSYSLGMGYDNIHNITHKTQNHELIDSSGKTRQVRGTTYDWRYAYNGAQPHAPTQIGTPDETSGDINGRTYHYDANGNQTGWDSDVNGTRRNIDWDDENRIQKIGDPSNTLEFAYDDTGERVVKRGQHGMTVYVNQYFTVRNLALASKHVFAGATRIATKVEPGEPVGYKEEPLPTDGAGTLITSATTTTSSSGGDISTTTEEPGLVDKALEFLGWKKEGSHPGQGIEHRSDRANEVAQNTLKNPNLTGQKPGQGRLSDKPGNNAGGNSGNDKTNNGGGNTDKSNNGGGNTVDGINGGGDKAPYDYGGTFLYFYHPDHLGSTAHVTDADGELYEHIQYFPFGEGWVQEAANTIQRVPYRYTSKELDEETGLYYFGARYYDPRTSVWQSPDPVLSTYLGSEPSKLSGLGGVFNPANLGLYSYGHNSPVVLADPDGNSVRRAVGEAVASTANRVVGAINPVRIAGLAPRVTPKVTAVGRVNGQVFTDVNQTARPLVLASESQPTLIAGRAHARAAKDPSRLTNSSMADAHAEIGVIEQANKAGQTKGQEMVLAVSKPPCGYCTGDIAAEAEQAGLKYLRINTQNTETLYPEAYYWRPGMNKIEPIDMKESARRIVELLGRLKDRILDE